MNKIFEQKIKRFEDIINYIGKNREKILQKNGVIKELENPDTTLPYKQDAIDDIAGYFPMDVVIYFADKYKPKT